MDWDAAQDVDTDSDIAADPQRSDQNRSISSSYAQTVTVRTCSSSWMAPACAPSADGNLDGVNELFVKN
ncbi:MAG: hypothetical protein JSW00_10395 [Thermoplasmata archaeon]|nr:MAG: hypothetical protein JSW00_10395 [Thermoplasmata archaeon]